MAETPHRVAGCRRAGAVRHRPRPGRAAPGPAGPSGSPAGASPTFRAAAGARGIQRGGRSRPESAAVLQGLVADRNRGSSGRRRHRVGPMARHRGRHRTTTAEPRSGRRLPSETGWLGLRSNSLACATRLRLISASHRRSGRRVGRHRGRPHSPGLPGSPRPPAGHADAGHRAGWSATPDEDARDGVARLPPNPLAAHQTVALPSCVVLASAKAARRRPGATTRAREESTAAECGGDATRLAILAGAGSTRRLTRRGRGRRDDKVASHGVMLGRWDHPRGCEETLRHRPVRRRCRDHPRGCGEHRRRGRGEGGPQTMPRGRGEHPRLVPSGGVRQGPSRGCGEHPRRWPSGGHEGGTIPRVREHGVQTGSRATWAGTISAGAGAPARDVLQRQRLRGPSPRCGSTRGLGPEWARPRDHPRG